MAQAVVDKIEECELSRTPIYRDPLGKNRDQMTATEQAAFDAVLDDTIPASDMTIIILVTRPLR